MHLSPVVYFGKSGLLEYLEDEVFVGGDLADSPFLDEGIEREGQIAFEEFEEVGIGDNVISGEEGT